MNKKELVESACKKLKEEGARKPITVPRRTFLISDTDGNQCKFHVKQEDKNLNYTERDVAEITDALIAVIEESLKRGESISIYGFGVLEPHYRAPRRTLEPISKKEVDIPARYVPKFTAGKNLRVAVKLWDLSRKDRDEGGNS